MKHNWLTASQFAHRGLHGPHTGFIENSLPAFNAALEGGYGFELDVLLSRDNVAMVIHDTTLARLTGQNGITIDFTAEEHSKIKLLGTDGTIPTLKETLDQTNGKGPILIEIKGDQGKYSQIAKAVWKDIKSYQGAVAIMSFYPEILEYFKKHFPGVVRGLVATSTNDGGLPKNYFNLDQQIKTIKNLEVDFIAYDISALPNEVTEYCSHWNTPVLTWTVRSDVERKHAQNNTDNIIFEL
ncbi:MAG: glycerophosphodiester phosphodiesterase [Kordiimonadaceae bacterium]|nr:glycerophosphodiester phosphodiesterase [Kordiimonadaceae bacterium]MBT6034857.1 glycerophosphodiester phosphodiesterase [Kordiimonadaceae bacterium]